MSGWLGTILLLMMVGVLWVMPLAVGFSFHYHPRGSRLLVHFGLFRPLRFNVAIPLGKAPSTKGRAKPKTSPHAQSRTQPRSAKQSPMKGLRMLRLFFSAVHCIERLEWHTGLGTGDAALTASLYGGLWALKTNVVAWLRRRFEFMHPPLLRVAPNFEETGLFLELTCIFRFTLGDIIVAVARFLTVRARGVRSFGTRPTSH